MTAKIDFKEIIAILTDRDPPVAFRDSLKSMFIAATRNFPGMVEDEAGVIIDHYIALDAFLEKLEAINED